MNVHPWLNAAWSGFQRRLSAGQMAHALLLQGPEGTGKFELATLMKARLLCTGEGEYACGECRSCTLFAAGAHPDAFLLTPEEGKHQVLIEQVRTMIDALTLTTSFSPRKVALISPAEAMNTNSANALLKSLEEPPGETVLILVSHDPSRLPVTIRSRCQSIAVALPGNADAVRWLCEKHGLSEEIAAKALNAAGGSPLRALEMVESGDLQTHQNLQAMLSSLLRQPAMVPKVAGKLADIDAGLLWTWLSNSSAEALRSTLTGKMPGWLDSALNMEHQSLARLQQHADRNRAFSKTPVRQDLLLQEWLIKWSQLAA